VGESTPTGEKTLYEDLMEQAVEAGNVSRALRAVTGNRGAAGIDGMKTSRLAEHLEKHWERIRGKLLSGPTHRHRCGG
jgi:retron-type reverse transcriptase